MSDRQAKMKATQDAITNNDYNAFKANADSRMLAHTPDQASFDKLVEQNKQMKANKEKEIQAIKDGNFDAYKAAETEEKTMMDANKPSNDNRGTRPTKTDADIKTEFDQLVAAYRADGSLPDTNMGFGGKEFGAKGRHGGGHGQNFENDK